MANSSSADKSGVEANVSAAAPPNSADHFVIDAAATTSNNAHASALLTPEASAQVQSLSTSAAPDSTASADGPQLPRSQRFKSWFFKRYPLFTREGLRREREALKELWIPDRSTLTWLGKITRTRILPVVGLSAVAFTGLSIFPSTREYTNPFTWKLFEDYVDRRRGEDKQRLFTFLDGNILEIGCKDGANLQFFPHTASLAESGTAAPPSMFYQGGLLSYVGVDTHHRLEHAARRKAIKAGIGRGVAKFVSVPDLPDPDAKRTNLMRYKLEHSPPVVDAEPVHTGRQTAVDRLRLLDGSNKPTEEMNDLIAYLKRQPANSLNSVICHLTLNHMSAEDARKTVQEVTCVTCSIVASFVSYLIMRSLLWFAWSRVYRRTECSDLGVVCILSSQSRTLVLPVEQSKTS